MNDSDIGALRTYVLDTNVLIHDPTAPLNFDEHNVVIPFAVLEELDGMKQEESDRGRQARQAVRLLDSLLESQRVENAAPGPVIRLPVAEGAGHEAGTLRFVPCGGSAGFSVHLKDNEILSTAYSLHSPGKDTSLEGSVILVTNDINMRVKAAAVGIDAEGYLNDAVFTDSDAMIDGVWRAPSPELLWDQIKKAYHGAELQVGGVCHRNLYTLQGEVVSQWYPSLLIDDGADFQGRVLNIVDDLAYVRPLDNFMSGKGVWGVKARDELQNFALNLLLDRELDLVTLAGPAGTGKTYLALAAAMHMVFEDLSYEKIIITRETVAMGEDIGFLPGTEEEKMAPWMAAFMDNIEQLVGAKNDKEVEAAMAVIKERVQMRSVGLMRGRSFSNTILIIDEAQNLSPKQVKNLITRAGKNTKIICLGNVAQIDTPYLNPGSTGLANLVQKFRNWQHAGHVTLRSIERSRLAAMAEEVL